MSEIKKIAVCESEAEVKLLSALNVMFAENARLTARIADLEKALRDVAEAKMPGLARYIARTTLEASERGENP